MISKEPLENERFVDEIHENDIIVSKNKKMNILFIIISILLILFSLLFLLYRKGIIIFNNTYHVSHNLFVVHANTSFGDKITDFSQYNTYDNSYVYNFSIHNNSDKKLFYEIVLEDINHNNEDSINKNNINYALIKNSELLFKGKLSSKEKNVLASYSIFSNQVDIYEIRMWVDNNVSGSLEFKINVTD